MRQNSEKQLPLAPLWPDHQLSEELKVISQILDQRPEITQLVLHDLCDKTDPGSGAPGMTAEQVLRCALLKQMRQFSYAQLAFHLIDSICFRSFCRLSGGYAPAKSTLQENVSRIRSSTWQKLNQVLVGWAHQEGLEKGRRVRIDSTVVEADIHYPLDSQLLYDAVRVTTRLLQRIARQEKIAFHNRCRRAKRRCLNIRNSRGENRRKYYADLIRTARQTGSYAQRVVEASHHWSNPLSRGLIPSLEKSLVLINQIIDQAHRRVILKQPVPVDQKLVSIFEDHADIICKGGRETLFGHKIFLTCGRSSLMLDCVVSRGNPTDHSWTTTMLERQNQLYGRYPRQASFDGGFASLDNLNWAKKQGIQDVAFAKKRGLQVENMARSSWVYKMLRRFRAGIEGCISTLKRVFGLDRCRWKGWSHFQRYVHASVFSYNLVVLARLKL